MSWSEATHLAGCVIAVWLSWSAHDLLQEKVFRIPGFHFGFFMAFVLQTSASLLAVLQKLALDCWRCCLQDVNALRAEEEEYAELERARAAAVESGRGLLTTDAGADSDETSSNDLDYRPTVAGLRQSALRKDGTALELAARAEDERAAAAAPRSAAQVFLWYMLLAALLSVSNGCASAALAYVTMPTKVLFKSSKIVTVMAMGSCFGKFYPKIEYVYMGMVVFGLVAFFMGGTDVSLTRRGAAAAKAAAAAARPAGQPSAAALGVGLLSAAVIADSLVPNVQQLLLQSRSKREMVFHTNWLSAALTAAYILHTGEMAEALAFLRGRPRACSLMLLQSGCGYLGIQSYLETVRAFGSKSTTVVTSCRKICTIALSSLVFHHLVTGYHLAGVLAVFGGVLLNACGSMRCSRYVAVPALAIVALVVTSQLAAQCAAPSRTAPPST